MSEDREKQPSARGQPGAPDLAWLFLRFDGRIGREIFWLGIGLVWTVVLAAIGLTGGQSGEDTLSGTVIVIGLAALWAEIALLVKRLHDRDLPGFWAVLAFLPLVGAAWVVIAGVLPGQAGPNSYGPGPDRRGH